jgi:lysophospholipase L1-like esterase
MKLLALVTIIITALVLLAVGAADFLGLLSADFFLDHHAARDIGCVFVRTSEAASMPTSKQSSATADSKKTSIRVACVGDSITSYACASNDTMTYPQQLQRILGTTSYEVFNFGDSGKTMLKKGLCGSGGQPVPPCGGDCSYWDGQPFQQALQSQPDIVTIMLGTNDAKRCNWEGPPNGSPPGGGTQFMADYLDMIQRFQALPTKPRIYVVIPPPLTHPPNNASAPPPFDMSPRAINTQYPALQRTIAWRGGANIGIIDVWTILGGNNMDPLLTCDGCHPKDEALTIIAQAIAKAIIVAPVPPSFTFSAATAVMSIN